MIHELLNSYMDALMIADSGEVNALMYAGACMGPVQLQTGESR